MEERIKINLKFNDKKLKINSPNVVIPVGGVTPSGTLEISQNGVHNVKYYEFANVNVPIPEGYLKPEGTLSIVENGEYSVIPFESVLVDVPIPEGYLKPEGMLEVSIEGTYDVTPYASVKFEVETEEVAATPTEETQTFIPSENKFIDKVVVNPIPSEYIVPNGNIDIVNTNEIDVTQYAKAQIKDENLKAENIAENVEVLGITGTFRGGINTSDGDVTADDILLGKVAYAKEERIVGTIETYDYSSSEEVKPEIDKFLQGEITELYNDRVTKIIANRCEMDLRLTKVDLPNVISIGSEAFRDCSNITSINLPKVTWIGDSAFLNCTKLNEIHIPLVTYIGGSAFSSCSSLTKLDIPLVTTLGGNAIDRTSIKTISVPSMTTVTSKAFAMSVRTVKNNLKTIYIPNATSCQGYAFYGACGTTAIIITQTEKVCTLPEAVANAFKYAWHYLGTVDSYNNPDGLKDGYIYVDASMVEQYKVATNWSALADQIKPLEELPQEIKEELGL